MVLGQSRGFQLSFWRLEARRVLGAPYGESRILHSATFEHSPQFNDTEVLVNWPEEFEDNNTRPWSLETDRP